MADISKISLPDGTTYNIKDSNALTDDLFNMTPIDFEEVTIDSKEHTYFPASELSRIQHYRPFATNLYDESVFGQPRIIGRNIWYCTAGTNISDGGDSNTRTYISIGNSNVITEIDLTTREITFLGTIDISWFNT